jgi:hypothetical protein
MRMVHSEEVSSTSTLSQNAYLDAPNAYLDAPNAYLDAPNAYLDAPNAYLDAPNAYLDAAIPFKCVNCYKTFTKSNHLKRHQPRCQGLQCPNQCPLCKKVLSSSSARSRHMKLCKDVCLELGPCTPVKNEGHTITNINSHNQIQNNTHNIGTQQNIVNIHINNFGSEDVSHISDEYKKMCIQGINGLGVKMMVEKTHFDPNVPENHNVRLKSKKYQQVQVKEDDRWKTKDSNDAVDSMMMKSCKHLMEHYWDSEIKNEDINHHSSLMIQNLMRIRCRNPSVYHTLRRQIFAMICDAHDKLLHDADDRVDGVVAQRGTDI